MGTVGIRELKSKLSAYLRRVQAGETFLVTDRGRVVAEIREPGSPYDVEGVPPGLRAMAEKEGVRLGRGNRGSGYPVLARLAPDGTAEELLDEERGGA